MIIEPRSGRFDEFAKPQHEADLIGLDPVEAARRPNGDREHDGGKNAGHRQDAPRSWRSFSGDQRGGRGARWGLPLDRRLGHGALRRRRVLAAQAIKPGLDCGRSHQFGAEIAGLIPHDFLASAPGVDRE